MIAFLVAVVVVAVVVLLTVGHGSSTKNTNGPTTSTQVTSLLQPVAAANTALASSLQSLTPGGNGTTASASVGATSGAVQRALGALPPATTDGAVVSTAQAALSSENAWLTGVSAALTNPQGADVAQLDSLAADARSKQAALAIALPTVALNLPGTTSLDSYLQAASSSSSMQAALGTFNASIESLLNQSTTGFTQINQLFQQLQTAANGGTADITLAQAEQTINSVVSNRNALAASAATLATPTPLAGTVRDELVSSLKASLTDDQDIATCLNQSNDGDIAVIFSSCLDSSSSDSQAATQAKQTFLASYNQLRSELGLPESTIQF